MQQLLFRYKQILRTPGNYFWALIFPIVLGSLFKVAFGTMQQTTFTDIPAAVVDDGGNPEFSSLLASMDGDLLDVRAMTRKEADQALADGSVSGIYLAEEEPELIVAENGVDQTALSSVLDGYLKFRAEAETIAKEHPEQLPAFIAAMQDGIETDAVKAVSLGGKTYDSFLDYFFSLIAMACFFGSFIGIALAEEGAANNSPLAARRSISPTSKLKSTLIDLTVGVSIQFVCSLIVLCYLKYVLRINFGGSMAGMILICAAASLIGVSFGTAVGCSGMKKGLRILLSIMVPLITCFLSGLMVGTMKQIIEHHAPIINRINPAALVSDAFYYLIVYPDRSGFFRCILILTAYAVGLFMLAFQLLRRNRYDSI